MQRGRPQKFFLSSMNIFLNVTSSVLGGDILQMSKKKRKKKELFLRFGRGHSSKLAKNLTFLQIWGGACPTCPPPPPLGSAPGYSQILERGAVRDRRHETCQYEEICARLVEICINEQERIVNGGVGLGNSSSPPLPGGTWKNM